MLAHDVDTVFGIPGVQTYPLYDALARTTDRITVYGPRHEQTAAYMAFGYAQATGRAGAVAAAWDVLAHTSPPVPCVPRPPVATPIDPLRIQRAVALLSRAKHPMIMVGSGARRAGESVAALAEFLQAPVVSFRGGRGVVSDEHPLGFTCAEGFERWGECDALIGIGSRLELMWSRWPDRPAGLPIILLDIDPQQFVRLEATVGILGDAVDSTAALLAALVASGPAARAGRRRRHSSQHSHPHRSRHGAIGLRLPVALPHARLSSLTRLSRGAVYGRCGLSSLTHPLIAACCAVGATGGCRRMRLAAVGVRPRGRRGSGWR